MGNVCNANGERLWREIRYSDNMTYHLDYIEGNMNPEQKAVSHQILESFTVGKRVKHTKSGESPA